MQMCSGRADCGTEKLPISVLAVKFKLYVPSQRYSVHNSRQEIRFFLHLFSQHIKVEPLGTFAGCQINVTPKHVQR